MNQRKPRQTSGLRSDPRSILELSHVREETIIRPHHADEAELNLLLPEEALNVPLWKSLLSSIDAALFEKKGPPLILTSKPVEIEELLGDHITRPWYRSIITNLRETLFQVKQPPLQLTSKPVEGQNELHDELVAPWYRSILPNIRDALFPRKLPPLELSSKPASVNEIWGFYDHRKGGALASTVVHVVFIALLVSGTIWQRRHHVEQPKVQHQVMPVLNETEALVLPFSETQVGGGGGGGDRDKLPETKGRLPKSSMEQFTPPLVVVRNSTPRLPMEPTVLVPPEIALTHTNLPNLGNPMATIPNGPLSNGTGSGGGIGSGSGGGVGSGEGPGVGPGRGGGTGGGVFRVGGGVSAPHAIYDPEPEYSREARDARYQGTVILQLVVGSDGLPRDIQIRRSLGMGLDEKAIETVRKWRFEPGKKDGRAVAVLVNVEVNFSLH